ncbi:ABC transporter permease [Acinetobacter haemolyticus]|uniref:ABC transporter permease n=1 Tax=Acinetobacter haemolyticus TaxID=29430 RepID=UPI001FB9F123|nr:hypothetical protein [Acinetobacter haemolyticus]
MKKLSVKARHSILSIVLPIIAILAFLGVWQGASQQIQTNIGNLPGPVEVLNAFKGLMSEFSNQREAAKTFYANLPEGSTAIFSAPPTFIDQILTSLKTVLTACLISSMIAIPIGLLCGLSPNFYRALNPLIQIFKPISPLTHREPIGGLFICPPNRRVIKIICHFCHHCCHVHHLAYPH